MKKRQTEEGTLMRTFGLSYTQPVLCPPASPNWHQFVVAVGGPLTVSTQIGTWLVVPGTGVWIPASVGCSFQNRLKTAVRMLYLPIEVDLSGFDTTICSVRSVSPLLRELVLEVVLIGALVESEQYHRHLAALIVHEIGQTEVVPLELPQPQTPAAKVVIEHLAARDFRLDALAIAVRESGCSRRTLERIFVRETELTLGGWLRRRRLLLAIDRLLDAEPVGEIAFALGYSDASAFIAAFRRDLGCSPTKYLAIRRAS